MVTTIENKFRSLARKLLPARLHKIISHAILTRKERRQKYFGVNNLDEKIEKYLNYESGFYVELGANNGKSFSNTLYYERHKHWRGVLIEPAPNLYLECRANRSPSRNYIVCAACVPFDYKKDFVKIMYSNAMSVSMSLESDLTDKIAHAELGRQFLKQHEDVFTFGALAKTLNKILQDACAPGLIDFMSLDVEGAELDVLKGVDHSSYRFKYLLVECRDISKLGGYLETKGYELIDKLDEHDYLFRDIA